MIENAKILCLIMIVSLSCACAAKQPIPTEWPPEEKAIHVHLIADTQLNRHDEEPHTLVLCLYQLRSSNAFIQLTEDMDGLYKLLECSLFDATVARAKRIILQPGQELTMDLDRAEGAKYVGVVAGYYLIDKDRIVRLFEVPLLEEKKGVIRKQRIQKPGPLNIELVLGPQQIHSAKGE